ncbi:MAG: hypothetical protein HOC23_11100 [Halieaceae bacterium]|nr:hypothetical protein [Halieaceae bacterium]
MPASELYPTLEAREIGEPNVDAQGEVVRWERALPFFAQNVIDLGFDLPNPYGIAIVPLVVDQDLELEGLEVGFNGQPREVIDFVQLGMADAENVSLQLKADVWLLPFMNVFATVGTINGDTRVPLGFAVADLVDFIGRPGLCSGIVQAPVCSEYIEAVVKTDYEGYNFTLGTNLAMGWDRYFVTLPISYTWSDIDITDSRIEALNVSPRFGFTNGVGKAGMLAIFVGATYLDADVDVTGTLAVDTSGIAGSSDSLLIDFKISQRNKDKWNYLAGFNWDLDKHWSLHAELGFGGSRENIIASLTHRF